jgi:hypothetical protein
VSSEVCRPNFLNNRWFVLDFLILLDLTKLIEREGGQLVILSYCSHANRFWLSFDVATLSSTLTACLVSFVLVKNLVGNSTALAEDQPSLGLLNLITIILSPVLLLSYLFILKLDRFLVVVVKKIANTSNLG